MGKEELVEEMTVEDCWEMLQAHEFARLAFHLGPEVHLVPINYVVDHGGLVFRTAPGNKLAGVLMNPDVVLEVDEVDEHLARSVVVRGLARRLDVDQQQRGRAVPLGPWVTAPKHDVVEIVPNEITGRAFRLGAT